MSSPERLRSQSQPICIPEIYYYERIQAILKTGPLSTETIEKAQAVWNVATAKGVWVNKNPLESKLSVSFDSWHQSSADYCQLAFDAINAASIKLSREKCPKYPAAKNNAVVVVGFQVK